MESSAKGRGALSRGVRPPVLCAACGSRFDSDGATAGDRLRCPLCCEVVEVADLVMERRPVRSRSGTPRTSDAHVPRDELRRVLRWIVVGLVAAVVVAALVHWRQAIWEGVAEAARERGRAR